MFHLDDAFRAARGLYMTQKEVMIALTSSLILIIKYDAVCCICLFWFYFCFSALHNNNNKGINFLDSFEKSCYVYIIYAFCLIC